MPLEIVNHIARIQKRARHLGERLVIVQRQGRQGQSAADSRIVLDNTSRHFRRIGAHDNVACLEVGEFWMVLPCPLGYKGASIRIELCYILLVRMKKDCYLKIGALGREDVFKDTDWICERW